MLVKSVQQNNELPEEDVLGNPGSENGCTKLAGERQNSKEGCEGKPQQFGPISYLNTSYKLLTGTISQILAKHVMDKELL